MGGCMHNEVCEHKLESHEEPCNLTKLCKFFDDGSLGCQAVGKKRGRHAKSGRDEAERAFDEGAGLRVDKKKLRKATIVLKIRKKEGVLSENQQRVLDNIKGKHFGGMSEEMKQQIVSMAAEPPRKKDEL